ncbi:MAG: phospholipid transport system substrate-binding protein [Enterobacterales bacterium]|jgi:phospholipid transport system substrate-binding protein
MRNLSLNKLSILLMLLINVACSNIYANTPTEALELTLNKLLAIAQNKAMDKATQKNEIFNVVNQDIDFEALSRRVVSKTWENTTADQKTQFKKLFSNIIVNTYFSLLEDYSDEKISYEKEQIKNSKYAIVDTLILTDKNKVPVRYRLFKSGDSWKIYDLVPEGISLVSSYQRNYSTILKKQGMDGLLEEMLKKELEKAKE